MSRADGQPGWPRRHSPSNRFTLLTSLRYHALRGIRAAPYPQALLPPMTFTIGRAISNLSQFRLEQGNSSSTAIQDACHSMPCSAEDVEEENKALEADFQILQTHLQELQARVQLKENPDGDPLRALMREALSIIPGASPLCSSLVDLSWGRASKEKALESTLQVLQEELDRVDIDTDQRRKLLKVLLRAVMEFKTLPPAYWIDGVSCDNVEPHRVGGFADVYRALWNKQAAAVKVMRMFSSQMDDNDPLQAAFLREIVVSRQVKHPFIQPFWGVDRITFAPRLGLISPWQYYGNINEAMESLDKRGDPIPSTRWLLQIAIGLHYLHSVGIVHGDLRGANILIDELLNPRLADFGLSILADSYTRTLGSHSGFAIRWSPPELLSGKLLRPNFSSDVYAFGCTAIELFGRSKPFAHIKSDVQVVYQVAVGATPQRPLTGVRPMPDTIWHIVEQCLQLDPALRPPMSDIVRQLEAVVLSEGT